MTRQVRVDVRWSRPAEPAGIISTYQVAMSTSLNAGDDAWNVSSLSGDDPLDCKFSVVDAPVSTVLYFRVSQISLARVAFYYAGRFSGPGKADGQVCVCVRVHLRTMAFDLLVDH